MVGASKSRLYRRGIVRSEQMRHARLIHDMRVSLKKWGGDALAAKAQSGVKCLVYSKDRLEERNVGFGFVCRQRQSCFPVGEREERRRFRPLTKRSGRNGDDAASPNMTTLAQLQPGSHVQLSIFCRQPASTTARTTGTSRIHADGLRLSARIQNPAGASP